MILLDLLPDEYIDFKISVHFISDTSYVWPQYTFLYMCKKKIYMVSWLKKKNFNYKI